MQIELRVLFKVEYTTCLKHVQLLGKNMKHMKWYGMIHYNVGTCNSKTGTSSWEEPILMRSVGRVELLTPRTRENMMYKKQTGKWKTAKDMTEDEAARKIQGAWRSKVALRNVREMVKKQYERVYDQDKPLLLF